MLKLSKIRSVIYFSLAPLWLVANVALIIYLTYVKDMSPMFRGMGAVLLGMFSIVVGIPFLIAFVVNLKRKMNKYESGFMLSKRVGSVLLLIFPTLAYIFISYNVISSIYYLRSSLVGWFILLYAIHFFILFRYSVAIIFNVLDKCLKWDNVSTAVFIAGAITTSCASTISITQHSTIRENQREIWMQESLIMHEERRQQTYIDSYTYTKEYAKNEILQSIQKQFDERLIVLSVIPSGFSSDTLISYEAVIGFYEKPHITFSVWRNYPAWGDVININYHVTENMLLNSELYDDKIQSFFNTSTFAQMTNLSGDNNFCLRMTVSVNDSNNIDEELESLFNMIQYFRSTNINIGAFGTDLIISFHDDEESALGSIQSFEPGFLMLNIKSSCS